jgi:predicted kinase
MKQTAVEWMVEQIQNNIHHTIKIPIEYFEQALEMEKEQIIDAVNSQRQLGWDEKGEQYYNETFKK